MKIPSFTKTIETLVDPGKKNDRLTGRGPNEMNPERTNNIPLQKLAMDYGHGAMTEGTE